MNQLSILLCSLSVMMALVQVDGQEKAAESIAVRIVPTNFREKAGRSITLWQPTQHFYVIVTNTSAKPLRLWKEWCSWGYYNLTFVSTDGTGKKGIVKKLPRPWTKIFPDWLTIDPGDHMVFEVSFSETIWQNAPLPPKGKSHKIKLKAVFEIGEDEQSKIHEVWMGKLSSPEHPYTIYR